MTFYESSGFRLSTFKTGLAPAELSLGSLYLKLVTDWMRGDAKPGQVGSKVVQFDPLLLLTKSKKWLTLAKGSPDKDVSKQAALALKSVDSLVEGLDPIKRDEAIQRYNKAEDDAANIHIPSHCKSKKAIQEEKNAIPQILGYSTDSGPYITKIKVLGGLPRQIYVTPRPFREHYKLACVINVHWSTGAVEMGRMFVIWHDMNGKTMASYGEYKN